MKNPDLSEQEAIEFGMKRENVYIRQLKALLEMEGANNESNTCNKSGNGSY